MDVCVGDWDSEDEQDDGLVVEANGDYVGI